MAVYKVASVNVNYSLILTRFHLYPGRSRLESAIANFIPTSVAGGIHSTTEIHHYRTLRHT